MFEALFILLIVLFLFIINWMSKKHISFPKRVFAGLIGGIAIGFLAQTLMPYEVATSSMFFSLFKFLGSIYLQFLKMIVVPLIFVSLVSSIIKMEQGSEVGKISIRIIASLIGLVMIAALVGIVVISHWHISLSDFAISAGSLEAQSSLEQKASQVTGLWDTLVQIVPSNIFAAFAGIGTSPILSVVFFSLFLGVVLLGLKRKNADLVEKVSSTMAVLNKIVMRMVTIVLRITPYGILGLIGKAVVSNPPSKLLDLIRFLGASYEALILAFFIQLLILSLFKFNVINYLRKAWTTFLFAFSSQSSVASLPLVIKTLELRMGVESSVANLGASLGTSIGQNGCAGIYPAMLSMIVAPSVGIDPFSAGFLIKLILIIGISSFGIAGIGGGATFAALVVLPSMGLPVDIIPLLIAVEPVIDMGRTFVNVSGSMVANLISAKFSGRIDMNVYKSKELIDLSNELES